MIIQLKCYYNGLNTAVILASAHQIFSAKYIQFSLTFME